MVALSLLLVACAEIQIERVFGPEVPGRYKHPASIAEFDNGDLYIAYYGGEGEYAVDTAVYGSRKAKGTNTWTPPVRIADAPRRSEGNAVVWQAPDGIVWLYYVVRYGENWSSSRIHAKISKDRGHTWSDSFLISPELGLMVRGKPIVLPSGNHLIPIYHEVGEDREAVSADCTSLFWIYDPKEHTWTESNRIRSRMGNIQPAPAWIEGDRLVCYCRRGGTYEPIDDGFVVRSESNDGGKTWSEGKDSQFPNPNAAVDMLRLDNGHLMLVYNDSMSARTPLTIALSTDGDKTYPHKRNIVEGDGDFGYPFLIQGRDGKIHLVYTSEGRSVVNHAVFEESDILGTSP